MTTVSITFQAQDKVSGEVREIKSEIVDLGKAADTADKKAGGLFTSLGGVGKVLGGLAIGGAITAVAGLGAALLGGIGDAKEAAIVFAQSEAVIKSTGGAAGVSAQHVADFSASLSAAAGKSLFGDSQIAESTNLLLTFTNIKGAVLDAATAMSVDMAQALGGAPADAAVQLGKALNDPIAGITALSRVGVSFSEEQKAMIATMMETGNVAGAQGVILAELNKEFGGSAQAAATAEGGMAMFKDQMGELAESIGAQVLPMLNSLMAWLTSPEVQSAITTIAMGLVSGFQTAIAVMTPVVAFIQENLSAVLASLAAMLIAVVVPAFITWAGAAATAAAATMAALAPVVLPIVAIGAAVALLVTAWNRDWGGMRTTITGWWNTSVQPILTVVKDWLDVKLTAAIAALQQAWSVAWPIIKTAVQVVYDWLKATVWPWIVSAFNTMKDTVLPALGTAFSTAWSAIKTAVSTAWIFMRDTVFPAMKTAIETIGTVINTLKSTWSTAWSAIHGAVSTASGIISGVISTIKSTIQGAIDLINTLIGVINRIPAVNIPTIPGLSGRSLGVSVPMSGVGTSGFGARSVSTSYSYSIDARGASDPRGVEAAVERAFRAHGIRTDLRTRTS
jgi:phage-related protein